MKEQLQDIAKLVRWRLEARRTGQSYAEIARQRTLIYRVEQVFLLHRATNRWLLHVADDPPRAGDDARIATMLSEVQQFAREYLPLAVERRVEEFSVRDLDVWIASGPDAYLAAVIRGKPPEELRSVLQDAIERIHREHGPELTEFNGDASGLQSAGRDLTRCLRSEYKRLPHVPRVNLRLALIAAGMAVPLFGAFAAVRSEQRWRDFVARLKSEPGILVATAERNWFAPSRIAGLRDPRARDPAAIAREAKVEPARIRFAWKDYTAGDLTAVSRPVAPGATPGTVRQRGEIAAPESRHALEQFEAQFPLPPNVKANVANRTLVLAGSAPYEWIDAVRQGATKIAGITAINGDDLVVEFDPELVLQRFREQFGLPDTVQAASRGGRLLLTGEAPHEWLDRVRRGAMKLPGIHVVDDRRVVDTDQRAFHEAKAALEEVAVVFVLNRDSIPADATPTVTRATDEARRCFEAAQKLGINVMLELRGYGDAVATEAENAKLSQRRAEAVRAAIAKSGVEPGKLKSLGLGAPPPPEPGEKPGAGKFDRRVFFRVVLQP